MDNSPGWARIPLRCASYDEPTVYWPWTRRVEISLVQLTLILGSIKRSFCDDSDRIDIVARLVMTASQTSRAMLVTVWRCPGGVNSEPNLTSYARDGLAGGPVGVNFEPNLTSYARDVWLMLTINKGYGVDMFV
ncbi:hypothetical protein DERF_011493 [Dermatophagoides farinae]|uniref:Uncharacterized protein n=1 Tax=Dermatophagoides farinae TaxID=6954 RepID=A0A922HX89_DERFA|nr:hypothetical protein DERF_011493 [Dermatophagoides farinae]